MEDETPIPTATPSYTQLTQERVPLEDAAIAFTRRDASGRIPIIIIPTRPFRIRNDVVILAVLMFGAAVLFGFFLNQVALASLTAVLGIILLVLGIYRSLHCAHSRRFNSDIDARRPLLAHHRPRHDPLAALYFGSLSNHQPGNPL
ncbi:MAG: hypothetical protein HND44_12380 [Chloroflexi bacterium]|nr:hypothetical protein [Ardenticatenaceae bacterium]NOG35353.1 hypothetical protein [Chloroflexota bacterium]GIK56967.1 MAG: hypothetical protein BroJett015_26300 [Chloroflexota bacterium]